MVYVTVTSVLVRKGSMSCREAFCPVMVILMFLQLSPMDAATRRWLRYDTLTALRQPVNLTRTNSGASGRYVLENDPDTVAVGACVTVAESVPVGAGDTVSLVDELEVGESVDVTVELPLGELDGDPVVDCDCEGLDVKLIEDDTEKDFDSEFVFVYVAGHAEGSTVKYTTRFVARAKKTLFPTTPQPEIGEVIRAVLPSAKT